MIKKKIYNLDLNKILFNPIYINCQIYYRHVYIITIDVWKSQNKLQFLIYIYIYALLNAIIRLVVQH